MKYFIILIILISSVSLKSQDSSAIDKNAAVEYIKQIDANYTQLSVDMWEYMRAVAHSRSAWKIERRRQALIETSGLALSSVKETKDFDGSVAYRDSVLSFLTISNKVLKEDYGRLVALENHAGDSYQEMEDYMTAKDFASEKLEIASQNLLKAQKIFCEKYGIQLLENTSERAAKLKKAGEVFDYYNEFYMVFFKSNFQESIFIQAMKSKDLDSMIMAKDELFLYTQAGISLLANKASYNGDLSVKTVTEELLFFYEEEALTHFPTFIKFYEDKAAFVKIKEELEKTPEEDRTQEMIDAYNAAGAALSEAVIKFNDLNKQLNFKRAELINKWNTVSGAFTDRNVPH